MSQKHEWKTETYDWWHGSAEYLENLEKQGWEIVAAAIPLQTTGDPHSLPQPRLAFIAKKPLEEKNERT